MCMYRPSGWCTVRQVRCENPGEAPTINKTCESRAHCKVCSGCTVTMTFLMSRFLIGQQLSNGIRDASEVLLSITTSSSGYSRSGMVCTGKGRRIVARRYIRYSHQREAHGMLSSLVVFLLQREENSVKRLESLSVWIFEGFAFVLFCALVPLIRFCLEARACLIRNAMQAG